MEPISLVSNQPIGRFYEGGARISSFRNEAMAAPHTPEDWIASTTSVRGQAPIGMTRLADGELLACAVSRDPLLWLGSSHLKKFGIDTMLLVKLLDAGQRLPVHAHPDGVFAMQYLSASHGKAEAWYILSPGLVHLGLQQDVGLDELNGMVAAQNSNGLLALMHKVNVDAGDAVFVPHGLLHAVGTGVLLAEVQEPEDLSILLEWVGFDLDGARDGHLGLGFDLALSAVDRRGRSRAEVEELVVRRPTEGSVLPAAADDFFRLDQVASRRDFPAGFAIVIALTDIATMTLGSGQKRQLQRGSTTLVPYAAGTFRIDGEALVARPPR
jgi:mannose-6-phosphate isomerase